MSPTTVYSRSEQCRQALDSTGLTTVGTASAFLSYASRVVVWGTICQELPQIIVFARQQGTQVFWNGTCSEELPGKGTRDTVVVRPKTDSARRGRYNLLPENALPCKRTVYSFSRRANSDGSFPRNLLYEMCIFRRFDCRFPISGEIVPSKPQLFSFIVCSPVNW